MSRWTTIDWDRNDAGASALARDLVRKLEHTEGDLAPLHLAEFLTELQADPSGSLWYAGDELLGFGLLSPDGVFRAVLLPDQREMSLFLPMLAWADSTRRVRCPQATLRVVAQDEDVSLPFLLQRLDFTAEGEGWSRSDDPGASIFRLYSGGQVEDGKRRG